MFPEIGFCGMAELGEMACRGLDQSRSPLVWFGPSSTLTKAPRQGSFVPDKLAIWGLFVGFLRNLHDNAALARIRPRNA